MQSKTLQLQKLVQSKKMRTVVYKRSRSFDTSPFVN